MPLVLLALLFMLSISAYGQPQPHRYLKKDRWDGIEVVIDRPGFKGEWPNEGSMPWATPESEFADERDFVHNARCAFQQQSQEDESTFETAFSQWKAAIEKGTNKGWLNGRRLKMVEIPTYFHVITDGPKGDITEKMIVNQMQVLNGAFEEAGFRFLLMKQGGKGASRTNNKKWHQGRDSYFSRPYFIIILPPTSFSNSFASALEKINIQLYLQERTNSSTRLDFERVAKTH